MGTRRWILLLFPVSLSLWGCAGNEGEAPEGVAGSVSTLRAEDTEQLLEQRVQPSLDFCRNCHIAGALAALGGGGAFMLTADGSSDLAELRASWERLGGNNPTSRILLKASGQISHPGGAPWPRESAAYANMDVVLRCFADADGCATFIDDCMRGRSCSESDADPYPLLGSAHGSHLWTAFCATEPDDAVLPPDPRSLVVPGVNEDKAVYFNAYWQVCRSEIDPNYAPPRTCGEYRRDVAAGALLLEGNGAVGAGVVMGADTGDAVAVMPVEEYNDLWRVWGLSERPDAFDALVAQRYGFALAKERNPYPLPGEDPNATDGGSGQLPMAFTQLRTADGSFTGRLGLTCHSCHGGTIGTIDDGPDLGPHYGVNAQSDLGVLMRDLGGGLGAMVPFTDNKTRGTGNVTNYQLLVMLWLIGDEAALPGITLESFVLAPSSGTEDSPTWWNVGHRPVKFYSGGMPMDATRIALQAYMPLAREEKPYDFEVIADWTDAHDRQAAAWMASLKSPVYPYGFCANEDGTPGPEDALRCIDKPLAQQGAILFHAKDLWAEHLNNPVPKPPGGNGSCASCHGAYSPRYVHDTRYLDTPALEGIAAFRVPAETVGTDPAYFRAHNQGVADYFKYSWLTYPPSQGDPGVCLIADDHRDLAGYLAPPLYGVWASAPYFHNGSVPNVWAVLKPSERPTIWRRASTPRGAFPTGAILGYDTDLARAYDAAKLGWKHDALRCGEGGTVPNVDCDPDNPSATTPSQQRTSLYNGAIALSWNFEFPPLTDDDIEHRKIYNTRVYSQDNQGHEFTAVLTDAERRAIIEYLKTL